MVLEMSRDPVRNTSQGFKEDDLVGKLALLRRKDFFNKAKADPYSVYFFL